MSNHNTDFNPIELSDYYPKVVLRILKRIHQETFEDLVLLGFSDNMKWLLRMLLEHSIDPILCDWRHKYLGYDCGGRLVTKVDDLENKETTLLVICVEEINELKECVNYFFNLKKNNIPVIYDRAHQNTPFRQEEPYKSIGEKARLRAVSMISDEQLFDLIQFIEQTATVPGDIVEFGSLHGGSGAVIAEASRHFGDKLIWLFDTFEGIPKSKYGLDHHWNGSFSNNSFSEVKAAFEDLKNVNVIKGNICETYNRVNGQISFGYLASDTLETGEVLLPFMWEKLSPGGIICVCDYGSFPNAIPLTVYVDSFVKKVRDKAFIMRVGEFGIYLRKNH